MAVYDIDQKKHESLSEAESGYSSFEEEKPSIQKQKNKVADRLISSLFARLFFFVLLIADIVWMAYSLFCATLSSLGYLLSGRTIAFFQNAQRSFWLSFKRSCVCLISLLIALFSPAFGILVACTYFLMYDKSGIEEVVPSSLQDQFKELFPH